VLTRIGLVVIVFGIACADFAPSPGQAATYRMVIQAHPESGGKCLDAPFGEFARGMRLQTWECNFTGSQIFTYDDQSQELKIGARCVESWGRGDPQDAVGLGACSGKASQHWRVSASGQYYQIIGVNNRCLDLRYGVNDNGVPLQIYACTEGNSAQLWVLIEAKPTFEKGDIPGNTFLEFDLPSADPALCQKRCLDDGQCGGWVYRAPEGRTNHMPHCWLRNNIIAVRTEHWDGLTYGCVR